MLFGDNGNRARSKIARIKDATRGDLDDLPTEGETLKQELRSFTASFDYEIPECDGRITTDRYALNFSAKGMLHCNTDGFFV